MTKLVSLRTIEHGVRRALAILGEEGAQEAVQGTLGVKRSASLFRKCADPDDERHHLQHRYAVALDIACARAGHLPPLLEVHRFLVDRHGEDGQDEDQGAAETEVLGAVLAIQAALGELSHTVREALHVCGPGGTSLTNRERHDIYEALTTLNQQTESIKRLIS